MKKSKLLFRILLGVIAVFAIQQLFILIFNLVGSEDPSAFLEKSNYTILYKIENYKDLNSVPELITAKITRSNLHLKGSITQTRVNALYLEDGQVVEFGCDLLGCGCLMGIGSVIRECVDNQGNVWYLKMPAVKYSESQKMLVLVGWGIVILASFLTTYFLVRKRFKKQFKKIGF